MRRVALIFNPASGQRPERRAAQIADVVAVLQKAGVEVRVIATESPESAGTQALEAIRDGCDTVLACGGDGTVHETLQRMVGEAEAGNAALGVIPMGTANALATDLGLPSSSRKAAKMLLTAERERISVGRVHFTDSQGGPGSRYFVVAAGIGADGLFFSRLDSRLKQRFGYLAYLVEALRLAFTHTFPLFCAEFTENGGGTRRAEQVSQVLAVRINNFGGMVNRLVPGAGIGNGHLDVIAFKTRSRWRYLRFMVAVWFGRQSYSETIELVECSAVECRDLSGKVHSFVEADGEWLGTLPVRIEVVREALTLLIPKKTKRRAG